MAIKLNKILLNHKKADVVLCNLQPNIYLKKAEEMHLGLHYSHSTSQSPSQYFLVLRLNCFGQHRYTYICLKALKGP